MSKKTSSSAIISDRREEFQNAETHSFMNFCGHCVDNSTTCSYSHSFIPIAFIFNQKIFHQIALVDTGSSTNLIDPTIVKQLGFQLHDCNKSISLTLADGTVSSRSISSYVDATILVSNSEFTCTFLVCELSKAKIILGMQWLTQHKAILDCSSGALSLTTLESPQQTIITEFNPLQKFTPPKNDQLSPALPDEQLSSEHCMSVLDSTVPCSEPKPILTAKYDQYMEVFSQANAKVLPPHRDHDHAIPIVPDKTPPFGPLYPLSQNELQVLKQYTEENLASGFIRRSSSAASSPIIFVKKKDGSLRLCVDYRGLNSVTIKNRYPLPLISEILDRVQGASIFTKIDLKNAYHLIRIKEGDEWKTAFRTRFGLFEYQVMPFGLTNAPASFQDFIQFVLRDYLDIFVIVYIDDILIFSDNQNNHNIHVKKVLQKLLEAELYANLEKCEFDVSQVQYVGFTLSKEGITMDPGKVNSILSWPVPTKLSEVQSFLGFANFYRRFINGYSTVVKPLTRLTAKNVPFHWDANCQNAFDSLKQSFTNAPILRHFDPTLPIIVETDASGYALAGILSQKFPNGVHPIAYHSRSLTPAEYNYDTHDRELLGVVECLKHWRQYLEGSTHRIQILCDHANLRYFMHVKRHNRRQAAWSTFLSELDFEFHYQPGKVNKADALSRREDYRQGKNPLEDVNPIFSADQFCNIVSTLSVDQPFVDKLRRRYPKDEVTQEVLKYQTNASDFADSPNLEFLKSFSVSPEGILFKDGKIYIPNLDSLKLQILQHCHDNEVSGHPGIRKTIKLILRQYTWPNIHSDVTKYCKTCDLCNRTKSSRHAPYGLLQPLSAPDYPWQSITMDFVTGLPKSNDYQSLLVVVDRLTKFARFIPLTSVERPTAPECADLVFNIIFCRHGLPLQIITDRDTVFTSKFWNCLLKHLKVKPSKSTAFHPQTDGQTERTNQTLEAYLRCYCDYNQENWSSLLPTAEFCYNNAYHSTIRMSPFKAYTGRDANFQVLPVLPSSFPSVEERLTEINKLHCICRENITKANETFSEYANRCRKESPDFQIGDKVWLNRIHIATTRPSLKLDYKKFGPYKITQRINKVAFKLGLPQHLKIHPVFHVRYLEPYHENTIPGRMQPASFPVTSITGDDIYKAETLLDSRYHKKKLQYFVKWAGFSNEENSWEPETNILDNKLIKEFHNKYPSKPGASN